MNMNMKWIYTRDAIIENKKYYNLLDKVFQVGRYYISDNVYDKWKEDSDICFKYIAKNPNYKELATLMIINYLSDGSDIKIESFKNFFDTIRDNKQLLSNNNINVYERYQKFKSSTFRIEEDNGMFNNNKFSFNGSEDIPVKELLNHLIITEFDDDHKQLKTWNSFKNKLINYAFAPFFEKLYDDIQEVVVDNENRKFTKKFVSNKYNHILNKEVYDLFGIIRTEFNMSYEEVQSAITSKLASYKSAEQFAQALNKLVIIHRGDRY
jgi:hypothetical protein